MRRPRGFRRTELGLTGMFLARRWMAQVRGFPEASAYLSWFADQQQSGPARHEFIELAAGAMRRASPFGRRVELEIALCAFSDSLISFKEINERWCARYAAVSSRLAAVLQDIAGALAQLAFNQNVAAELSPIPWLRIEEAEAVGLKLEHAVVSWDKLEQVLGLQAASPSGNLNLPGDDVEPPNTELPNSEGSDLDVGIDTPSFGANSEVAPCEDEPAHAPVRRPAPPGADPPFSERLLEAIAAGIIKTGTLVHLPTSSIAFLSEAPILSGGLVDRFSLQLAEYGALMLNPPASGEGGRLGPRRTGRKVWRKISRNLDRLRPQLDGDDRRFADFQKYVAWPGRQSGDIASSEGVIVRSLVAWILEQIQGAPNNPHRSDSADEQPAASGDGNGPHYIGLADELADIINVDLARQARGWCDQLNAIKVEAQRLKHRYMVNRAAAKMAPMPVLVDRLDSFLRRMRVLGTFSFATYELASLLRLWTSEGVRKDLSLFCEQCGPCVCPTKGDVGSAWMAVLARIYQETLSRCSGYLLPLFQAVVQQVINELLRLIPETNENVSWTRVGFTFDELVNDLQRELGSDVLGAKQMDRYFRDMEKTKPILSRMPR